METDTPLEKLTRLVQACDEAAIREFHARFFDRLYRYVFVAAQMNPHLASEIVNDAFIKAVDKMKVFTTEDHLWNWLRLVARNTLRDARRKERRRLNLLERIKRLFSPGATVAVEKRNEHFQILHEAISTLNETDRRILEEKYFLDKTVAELAERHALTEKAVESRLMRGRAAIASYIRAQGSAP